jgi:hypothetical protein
MTVLKSSPAMAAAADRGLQLRPRSVAKRDDELRPESAGPIHAARTRALREVRHGALRSFRGWPRLCLSLVLPAHVCPAQDAPGRRRFGLRRPRSRCPAVAERSSGRSRASLEERPGALVPLYVSFGVSAGARHVHSTRALARGAVEANPVMKGIAEQRIGHARGQGRRHSGRHLRDREDVEEEPGRRGHLHGGTNSAMAWVVQRNYQVR